MEEEKDEMVDAAGLQGSLVCMVFASTGGRKY